MNTSIPYVGRFAPTPSGHLHFGSLIAALGSYLRAKSQNGQWIVRIEDLDPPREMTGASQHILHTLESYGLEWDGDVVYQSQRHDLYLDHIHQWLRNNDAYYCQCTRKDIQTLGGVYQGRCRNDGHHQGAIRLKNHFPISQFNDQLHGTLTLPEKWVTEDLLIQRRDGLFAYNLAVVLDDIDQGITEVVRGADLIDTTGRQIGLYQQLQKKPIDYLHLPLAVTENGNKLSKQNHAPEIDSSRPQLALISALRFLGQIAPDHLQDLTVDALLLWATQHWQLKSVPQKTQITLGF
jgi:glutamyl-Q tRNA(Asp) synthetase